MKKLSKTSALVVLMFFGVGSLVSGQNGLPSAKEIQVRAARCDSMREVASRRAQIKPELDQLTTDFEAHTFSSADGSGMSCRLYKPKNHKKVDKLPLIVYLHGGDGRGNDNTSAR